MSQFCRAEQVAIWAYCLMPNHVHLIVVPQSAESLRRAIGEAHRRYTRRIYFREGWRGHLWQGRFASFVMDEDHLLTAARYVELNPVRAGLVQAPSRYRWSSAAAHLRGRDDALVQVAPLVEMAPNWRRLLTSAIKEEEALPRWLPCLSPLADWWEPLSHRPSATKPITSHEAVWPCQGQPCSVPTWTCRGILILTGMMAAMVHVLWAYDGWVNITPLADELRDPGRNIPRSLILGIATLIAVYLGMTLAYHFVLPLSEVASANKEEGGIENAVAAVSCRQLLGGAGVVAISLLVMCSTFISLNGNALTGPRAYFAMARDGLLTRSLCLVHPRFRTPANAVLAQGLWAILLTVAGTALIVVPPPSVSVGAPGFLLAPVLDAWTKLNKTPLYDLLLTYVIFGANLFYLLAITSVFVLRIKQPDLPRPYRTWGYPYTPLLYVAAAVLLLGNMLVDPQSRVQALSGSGLILLGIPVWALLRRPPPRT